MAKRTDYSKISHKAKKPKSIRYNVKDFEDAVELSGRSTVQGLWDYLLAKYLADMGVRMAAPIGKMEVRPIDKRVFDVSKDVGFYMPMHKDLPPPKVNFVPITEKAYDGLAVDKTSIDEIGVWPTPKRSFDMDYKPVQKNSEGFDIDEMPMWQPKPKTAKAETKAETERAASAATKRLKEMQERAEKLKGKKK
jgi:hypothetical protein